MHGNHIKVEVGTHGRLRTRNTKNRPEEPSFFEVGNRAGLVLSQLAGLRLLLRNVHGPMLVQALVNPTMRPDFPVLCRAVSQIVVNSSSVTIEEVFGRHLEAVGKRRCVGRACPLCRMRGSLIFSELPPRTHLHHRRRVLPRSVCCRIRAASPTSGRGELAPEMRRYVRSRVTSPSPAIRKTVRGVLPDVPQFDSFLVLVWLLVSARSVGACAVAFERGHRPASEASLRPKRGICLTRTSCVHHRDSGKTSKTDDVTRRGYIVSDDFGDHTKLRFLSKLPPDDATVWNTSSMASEASLGTPCRRSSPLLAMNICPSVIASYSGRAFSVPRLLR